MAKYGVEKYNIVIHQHPKYGGVETIAFSTYAGKPVYGKAICRAGDEYDEETGKRLAIARCARKIARKRLRRADQLCKEAEQAIRDAIKHENDMAEYYMNALMECFDTQAAIEDIITKLA